jgi:excinuclease ABC subunit A
MTNAKSRPTAIEVRGARTHNLKGIDCRVPHRQVTVVTGPSGAGKSSLAFDTIFAEGQRRFVESMSTYARQFLDQMERPPVESVDNILPPVALEARNSVRNARSTVGTITEVNDVLRLLYTHLGTVHCPEGHGPVRRWVPEEVARLLTEGEVGENFLLVAPLPRPPRQADAVLGELIRQGFARRLDSDQGEGSVTRMEPGEPWPKALDPLPLVLGRFRARPGEEAGMQLTATVEEGMRLLEGGEGRIEARGLGPTRGQVRTFSRRLGCIHCGRILHTPVPALFSFNSPLGACTQCQGFGRVMGIDPERVIPDPGVTLAEHPIAPWNSPAYEEHYEGLFAACQRRGVPLDVPWQALDAADRQWVWSGDGSFVSLDQFFGWLEKRIYKLHVRVLLARYRAYNPCLQCAGQRLKPEALAVSLEGRTLPELTALSVEELRRWLKARQWSPRQREVAGHLLDELEERVEVLHRVGLDYLTLERQARTLSGGETQRIHLAAALGSGLTSTLYVLDEPTIGLHPSDSARLLKLLKDLAARGNTVLVVEHDPTLIRGADHIIDLGPRAGEGGGQLMVEGTPEVVLAHGESLTGQYLSRKPRTRAWEHRLRYRREHGLGTRREELEALPAIEIHGARAHNLRGIDVRLPLGTLVAITGVSGSGKSTLIKNVLHGTYQRSQGVVDVEPGECDALVGLDGVMDITLVDQSPLGRSTRSNPVTYIKAYDEIRKLFAATPVARARGITPAHFSFNVDRGRCPECRGTGVTEVDMQFMAPVSVVCEKCQGRRFQDQVLRVRFQDRTIHEVLELTVEEAQVFFAPQVRLCRRLATLVEVGLGYLRLGQPTSTLSGGEAQRLKLASFLDPPASKGKKARRMTAAERHLFLFDEPTTGLHLADIDLLYRTLRTLVQRGHGVVVVEHSTELVARADWIVDLGPGGGSHGGDLLFAGPLEEFVEETDSPTARELRRHLGMKPQIVKDGP